MPDTRPGCQRKCGNVSIPYPFGLVGDDPTCFKNDDFKLFCNTAILPPKLTFYGDYDGDEHTILHISLAAHQLTTSILGSVICYTGERVSVSYSFPNTYRLSNTRNRFMAVGCDTYGKLYDYKDSVFYVDCRSSCLNDTEVTASSSCGGFGCCQTTIPNDLNDFLVSIGSRNGFEYTRNISRCGLGVLLSDEQDSLFDSQVSQLWEMRNDVEHLLTVGISTSIILDWAILRNQSCEEAQRSATTYACGSNTYCTNSTNGPGYLCNCLQGYQGNPYLPDGCQAYLGDGFLLPSIEAPLAGYYYFSVRQRIKVLVRTSTSVKHWKERFFFVRCPRGSPLPAVLQEPRTKALQLALALLTEE
ncbi:PREDICTED: wall-associated receptor kinase 2-like [Nelumbo nucifera]|uniref:Wall-associated receptor kinase 2-like n=1 Tax=Nelumbo nucifera TaxID=4432 RepID=A0A1U7ZII1_NELNU|nr:PREDICTED: wall-associated receptor kinase 2-like [Nelumbo nucifera]